METYFPKSTEDDWKDESKPLCIFPRLKECLTQKGIAIGQAGTWRSVGTVDVLPEDIGERILFEQGEDGEEGIFYIDDEGVKRRGFMYKTHFYFEWKGRINRPKFHICKCSTIESFGRDAYRFANAEPVKVYSKNAHREVEVEGMELCGYCRHILKKMAVSNSTDFVAILKEAGEVKDPADFDVDLFGYVRNWEEISLAYRTKMNFTCERCSVQVGEGFDHFYMQTHHKNGIKTDNRELNLECLCIKCHSEVDDVHRENFSSPASRFYIDEFMSKYGHKRFCNGEEEKEAKKKDEETDVVVIHSR